MYFRDKLPLRVSLSKSRLFLMKTVRYEDRTQMVSFRIQTGYNLHRMSVLYIDEFYSRENWPQNLKVQLFKGERKSVMFMPQFGLCYSPHHILFTQTLLKKYMCALDYVHANLYVRVKGRVCQIKLVEESGSF